MTPLHAISITLPPDYFSPGTTMMHGKLVGSLWAIAYWEGQSYRFEREKLGAIWRFVA